MKTKACAVFAFSCWVSPCMLACEEIAVLYGDGKYLLLDADKLEVVDVGNLRWQGVWEVDLVIAGSSSRRFAVVVDGLSGEHHALTRHGGPSEALVAWENLTEEGDTASSVAVSQDYEIHRSFHARWIHGTDRLAVWQHETSEFSLVDGNLRRLAKWSVPDLDIGETLACGTEDELIIGGRRHRTRLERTNGIAVDALAFPDGTEDCRMSGPFLDCLGGFECRRNGQFVNGVLDLARNKVMFAFEYRGPFTIPKDPTHSRAFARFENRLLFEDSTRLLQQEVLNTPPWPGTNAYEATPTRRLRVLDTATGRTVVENEKAPMGTTSPLLCEGGAERVVVSASGKAHLIDLTTLETIASESIPLGQHFVF